MTPEDMNECHFPVENVTTRDNQTKVDSVTVTGAKPSIERQMNKIFNDGIRMRDFEESISQGIVYETADHKLEMAYLGLGISDEAGEVSGKIKKYLRGDYSLEALDGRLAQVIGDEKMNKHNEEVQVRKNGLALELGDTLWYLTRLAHVLGFTLTDIMELNMTKLADRRARNVTKGDGDYR